MSTGCVTQGNFRTEWVPGATFYYEPELKFQSLLPQRRRWINGTNASFDYLDTTHAWRTANVFVERALRSLWMLMRAQTFILKFCSAAFCCAFFETWSELFTKSYSTLLYTGGLGGACRGMSESIGSRCWINTSACVISHNVSNMTQQFPGCNASIVDATKAYERVPWTGNEGMPWMPQQDVGYNSAGCSATEQTAAKEDSCPAVRWCGGASVTEMENAYKFWGTNYSLGSIPKGDLPQLCQPHLDCCEPVPYLAGYVCAIFILWHTVWTLWAHYHTPER